MRRKQVFEVEEELGSANDSIYPVLDTLPGTPA